MGSDSVERKKENTYTTAWCICCARKKAYGSQTNYSMVSSGVSPAIYRVPEFVDNGAGSAGSGYALLCRDGGLYWAGDL